MDNAAETPAVKANLSREERDAVLRAITYLRVFYAMVYDQEQVQLANFVDGAIGGLRRLLGD